MKCATDGCEREALHSTNPAVVFSRCQTHTGQLMAQAFGALDSPLRAGPGWDSAPAIGHPPGPEQAAEKPSLRALPGDA